MANFNWFIEFFAKYWLTVLFGLIASGLAITVKHYQRLIKKEKENKKQEDFNNLITNMKTYVDETFKDTESSHKKLYKAVLDVQSKQFQRDCYNYLTSNREITLEEFNNLYTNYEIYKSLGGNGIGTMLFEKVEEKYSTQLFSEQILDATVTKVQEMNAVNNQQEPSAQIIHVYHSPIKDHNREDHE